MPKSGSEVLKTLQIAHQQVADQLRGAALFTEQIHEQFENVSKQIQGEFSNLAQFILPNLSEHTVQQTPQQFRDQLLIFLDLKRKQTNPIRKEIESFESKFQSLNVELEQTSHELAGLERNEESLKDAVAERLKDSVEFQDLVKESTRAELRLASNEDRLKQVRKEADEKLPSYHQSRLFMYLQQRQYGTRHYKSTGITRFFDRRLASFIDFETAMESVRFLKTTPELMATELENRKIQFQEGIEKIEALEQETEQQEGLSGIQSQILSVRQQRKETIDQIDAIAAKLESLLEELTEKQSSNCQMYKNAVAELRHHLEETEKQVLKRSAEKTESSQDDKIVEELFRLEHKAEELQTQLDDSNKDWNMENEKLKGLDEIINRFRRNNFDSYRSSFSGKLELEKLIERYLEGRSQTSKIWEKICRNQKFGPSWAEKTATEVLKSSTGQVIVNAIGKFASEVLGDLGEYAKESLKLHYKKIAYGED